jgi:hypothetical protein
MKRQLILCIAIALLFPSTCLAADPPEHQAIRQFRAYVTAVRAGDAQAVQKLAVPVSKPLQPAQAVLIKLKILEEQLRRETVAQFGPIDFKKEELWELFGQPSDDDLKDIRVKVHGDENIAGVLLKNPHTGQHDHTALMVRRDNQWFVPLTLQLNEEGDKLREPDADERQGMLKFGTKTCQDLEKTLDRLRKKELKSPAQVMQAMMDAMPANGEIDK